MDIPIDSILVSPYDSRRRYTKTSIERMSESLLHAGQLVPVKVRPSRSSPGKFELIYGYRRFMAAKALGWKTISADVVDVDDESVVELSLIENFEREDLSDYEKALIFQRMNKEFGKTYEQIGKILGISKQHISNCIRMVELFDEQTLSDHPELVEALYHLTEHHARILAHVSDIDTRIDLTLLVAKNNLTVRNLLDISHRLRSWFKEDKPQMKQRKVDRFPNEEPSDKFEIAQIIKRQHTLAQYGNFDSAIKMGLYDNEFYYYSFSPLRIRLEKEAAFSNIRKIWINFRRNYISEIRDIKIDVLGRVAVVTLTLQLHPKDIRSHDIRYRGTVVLLKKSSRWRIYHEHWSAYDEKDTRILEALQY